MMAARAAGATHSRQAELDKICDEVQRTARHHKIGMCHAWKKGDIAVRRGMGLCELVAVHRPRPPPPGAGPAVQRGPVRVEGRMVASGDLFTPTELGELVPLTRELEASARKK